ncbi:MAG: hypothetical protein IKB65_03590 [Ruminiclostridium sp.]|nr:hypothetical protein [Ruminiclostridium sp.]
MSTEESKSVEAQSQDQPKQGSINRLPPKISSRKSKPVTVYLSVLFVVALLLLVMSFFMQQRSHQALEDLTSSMEESQDAATLQMDNQRLQYELEQAQGTISQMEETQKELESKAADAEKQAQALEWLRLIEEAVRTSYSQAKDLVEQFEKSELTDYLPTQSVVEGAESPADVYKNIYAMLF